MIKKATLIIAAAICLVLSFSAVPVYAADNASVDAACQGVAALGGTGCGDTKNSTAQNMINTIVNLLSWVVGIVSVVMIILGGFLLVTSSGDPQKVTRGRQAIIYAIIGLVVVAMAQVIVKFVISRAK